MEMLSSASSWQEGHSGSFRGSDSSNVVGWPCPRRCLPRACCWTILMSQNATKCWKLNAIRWNLCPRNLGSLLRFTETCLRCRCNEQLRMLQQVGFREKGLGGGNWRRRSNLQRHRESSLPEPRIPLGGHLGTQPGGLYWHGPMPTVKVKQYHDFPPSTPCRTYAPCASSERGPLGVSQNFGMFQAKKSLSKLLAPLYLPI